MLLPVLFLPWLFLQLLKLLLGLPLLLLPLLPPLLCMGCRDAWWCIGREAGRGDIARLLFAYCT